jgi:Asp-tRNA(Asn)/Glu-tRNA(Gln) amidotransferase A subunit family amidase
MRRSTFLGQLLVLAAWPFAGCVQLSQWNARLPGSRAIITPMQCEQKGKRLRLAVKDNIDVAGVVTSAGSKYLAEHNQPAAKDAPCLAIVRDRNVQIVGKTNMSEFAVSPSGVNEYYGTPRNPFCFWTKRIPGGSSSGSAVAVASGIADVAFGTDTAGSIRVPAACCGVVGLKTTKGLVSIEGVVPIEPEHLDTVGPLARDVIGTAAGMDLLVPGFLRKYDAEQKAHPSASGIRVGRLHVKGTDPKIDAAVDDALRRSGFTVVPLDAAFTEKFEAAKRDGNVVAASGAWISEQKYQSAPGVSLRTKVVILNGRLNYQTKYKGALSRRAQWQGALADAFKKVDFIALPTLNRAPLASPSKLDLGLLEAQMLQMQNTVAVNYAGNPAVAMPIPLHGAGFAVASVQLIGPNNSEAGLLNAGRFVEAKAFSGNPGSSVKRLMTACPTTGALILKE